MPRTAGLRQHQVYFSGIPLKIRPKRLRYLHQLFIDRTPAVPPAPAASFDDVKHDLERASGSSKGVMHGGEHEVDSTKGQANLARRLNARQITFIGFSGGIGTGLFIGTGSAYAKSGPAGLLLAYLVVGSILWCVMQSISELGTLIPTAGSFPHWASRFIDPSVGFSLALSYGYCYTIAIAS